MPNWKKVLTSGSDAALNTLTVSNGITGSLLGTASFASTASFSSTASFINVTGSNVFVQGGNSFGAGAVLGTNDNQSLILETSGSARLTITNAGIARFSRTGSGNLVELYDNNNNIVTRFLNNGQAVYTEAVTIPYLIGGLGGTLNIFGSTFIGADFAVTPNARLHIRGAGSGSATTALRVQNSALTSSLVILDNNSGSYNGGFTFTGNTIISGSETISGSITFTRASTPSAAGVIGRGALGLEIRGVDGGSGGHLSLLNAGGDGVLVGISSTRHLSTYGRLGVGIGLATPSSRLQVRGEGTTNATETLRIQNSAATSSLVILDNNSGSYNGNFDITGSLTTTGNVGIGRSSATASLDVAGTTRLSGSFNTAASGSILTVIGSGSAQPIFTVQGSQGELFSVTDSLSGSLFSVNDISGLPIMEVFSDNTILMGDYQDPMLLTTRKITQTNSGSFVVYSIPTASYDGAFFEFTIKSGSNARVGTIMSTWAGSSIEFSEVDTMDIGNTTAVGLTQIIC